MKRNKGGKKKQRKRNIRDEKEEGKGTKKIHKPNHINTHASVGGREKRGGGRRGTGREEEECKGENSENITILAR